MEINTSHYIIKEKRFLLLFFVFLIKIPKFVLWDGSCPSNSQSPLELHGCQECCTARDTSGLLCRLSSSSRQSLGVWILRNPLVGILNTEGIPTQPSQGPPPGESGWCFHACDGSLPGPERKAASYLRSANWRHNWGVAAPGMRLPFQTI